MNDALVLDLAEVRMSDVAAVGGKSASLGEMISQLGGVGVRVPGGFATTAHAYRLFLAQDGLDKRISERVSALDADDVKALAAAGEEIRGWILQQGFPAALEQEHVRHPSVEDVGRAHPAAHGVEARLEGKRQLQPLLKCQVDVERLDALGPYIGLHAAECRRAVIVACFFRKFRGPERSLL